MCTCISTCANITLRNSFLPPPPPPVAPHTTLLFISVFLNTLLSNAYCSLHPISIQINEEGLDGHLTVLDPISGTPSLCTVFIECLVTPAPRCLSFSYTRRSVRSDRCQGSYTRESSQIILCSGKGFSSYRNYSRIFIINSYKTSREGGIRLRMRTTVCLLLLQEERSVRHVARVVTVTRPLARILSVSCNLQNCMR
jgi:hypothetical protein